MNIKKVFLFLGGTGFAILMIFIAIDFLNNEVTETLITEPLSEPLSKQVEAFEISDPSPEETRQIPLEVLMVKPQTEDVPDIRQISITFNKPMVPLGDYKESAKNLPITVSPEIPCQWRWLNRMSLSCYLDQPLPPSNAYTLRIESGLRAYDQTTLESPKEYKFSTRRWNIVKKTIEWKMADLPEVFWTFNQPMEIDSIRRQLSFSCGKVSVDSVSSHEAEKYFIDPSRSIKITAKKKLGLEKDCTLKLKKVAKALYGSQPGQGYEHSFTTHPDFEIAGIHCGYQSMYEPDKNKYILWDCPPDRSVRILFTTPVFGKDLANNVEVDPFFGWSKGGQGSPEYYKQNPQEQHEALFLRGPLEGRQRHRVHLGNIKDIFGRSLKGPKVVDIHTLDFYPHLDLPSRFGVLEKDGPLRVGFDAINIDTFRLKYGWSQNTSALPYWKKLRERDSRGCFLQEDAKLMEKTIKANNERNKPLTLPLDLKELVPELNYGLFYASADQTQYLSAGGSQSRSCDPFVVLITDLGITAKIGFFSSGAWIHSIKTGQPLEGVNVSIRSYDQVFDKGVTDKNGFVSFKGASEWDPDRESFSRWMSNNRLFFVAEKTGDFSVLPFYRGADGLEPYNFSTRSTFVGFSQLTKSQNHIVHAITDRVLYQPKQKVNIKVFARHWQPKSFGLRPAESMKITVKDALGKDVIIRKLALSEFGTAHLELNLDTSAPLGRYSIFATIDKWQRRIGEFRVQEFTLLPFKVEVEAIKDAFSVGESATFKTSGQYHFGGNLGDTQGKFVATFDEISWSPSQKKWQEYSFDDSVHFSIPGYDKPRTKNHWTLAKGTFKTDREGQSFQQVLLSPTEINTFGRVTFEASFQDDRGKTVASRAGVDVYSRDFQIGLKKDQWAYTPDEKILPKAILLSPGENPQPGVEITLKLVHRNYQTIRRRSSGNYYGYETRTTDQVVDQCQVTSKLAPVSCALQAKAAGSHYILAEAKDKKGLKVNSSLQTYVTGSEYVGWYRENHDRIEIIPDKAKYQLGEEVSLLIKNPYKEVEALITIERFGILKQMRKKLTSSAEIVKIPIDSKDYAPGFHISVQLIKGRVSEKIEGGVDLGKPSFKMGLTFIEVIDPETLLTIKASTAKDEYEPGMEVEGEVFVSSPSGRRIAEVSIAVVDEKILQQAGKYAGHFDLHNKFYQVPGADVVTSQLLNHIIGRRHFGKKGAPEGGDGGNSTSETRNNFLPLAYWNPTLITNPTGKAKFKFKVPDNLTSWKIIAVAVDKEHRFGFSTHSFKSRKKLMVEPALPSFLTEGDKLTGRFVVFNQSERSGNVVGSLMAEGVKISSSPEKKIPVKKDGKSFLEWDLQVPFEKNFASLQIKAYLEETADKDKALYEVPIRPFVAYDVFSQYGSTVQEDSLEIPLEIPRGIRSDLGGVDLIFSTSLLSQMNDVFTYAFEYPYSCWEQKMFKALMMQQYLSLKSYLNLPAPKPSPLALIKDLLKDMGKYQSSNGGMGYWKSHLRTVDPYLSVFTSLGLLWLNQNNIPIPQISSQKVFDYTDRLLLGKVSFPKYYNQEMKATVEAMAIYIGQLRKKNMIAEINRLYEKRKEMSLFGKSFLWSAALRDEKAKTIADELRKEIFSLADLTSGKIRFQESLDNGFSRILTSSSRTNCQLLISLLQADSKGPFVQPLVRAILADRKKHNRWRNTQENIFCLNALANYVSVFEKEAPDFTITGKIAETAIEENSFQGFNQQPKKQTLGFSKLFAKNKTSIELKKAGKGRLYYTTRMRVAYKEIPAEPVHAGMQVRREYFLKEKTGQWRPLSLPAKIHRGDIVRIKLAVDVPALRTQVALVDSLPAGLEPLNAQLATTSQADIANKKNDDNLDGDSSWLRIYFSGGFYHSEMKLFGAQYFADFLPQGKYNIEYTAQAVAVGEFNVSPALIEEMYDPDVYGRSKPARFVIEE